MVTHFNDHAIPLQSFTSGTQPCHEQQGEEAKFEIQAAEKRTATGDAATLLFGQRNPKHHCIQDILSIKCVYRQKELICNAFMHQGALFVTLPSALDQENFHACIVRLSEFAEEQVPTCDSLVMIIEKDNKMSHMLLRALLYFGFQLVDPAIYSSTPSFVLLGYELN